MTRERCLCLPLSFFFFLFLLHFSFPIPFFFFLFFFFALTCSFSFFFFFFFLLFCLLLFLFLFSKFPTLSSFSTFRLGVATMPTHWTSILSPFCYIFCKPNLQQNIELVAENSETCARSKTIITNISETVN